MRDQALGQNTGERGNVELDEIGEFAVEHAFQGIANHGMVTAECEHPETAQEIEVPRIVTIEEVLPLPALEPDIVANGFENPDELLVQIPRMERATLKLAIGDYLGNV
ncbi:hypothetical protein GCM10022626_29580 [[Pseudomonas] carboxydohydrogena]